MTIGEEVSKSLGKKGNCAEVMLIAFTNHYPELAAIPVNCLTGFGGGFARRGEVCGGIVTATAILSYCHKFDNRKEEIEDFYENLRLFYEAIEKVFGSIRCHELKEQWQVLGYADKVCPHVLEFIGNQLEERLEKP